MVALVQSAPCSCMKIRFPKGRGVYSAYILATCQNEHLPRSIRLFTGWEAFCNNHTFSSWARLLLSFLPSFYSSCTYAPIMPSYRTLNFLLLGAGLLGAVAAEFCNTNADCIRGPNVECMSNGCYYSGETCNVSCKSFEKSRMAALFNFHMYLQTFTMELALAMPALLEP